MSEVEMEIWSFWLMSDSHYLMLTVCKALLYML